MCVIQNYSNWHEIDVTSHERRSVIKKFLICTNQYRIAAHASRIWERVSALVMVSLNSKSGSLKQNLFNKLIGWTEIYSRPFAFPHMT